MSRTNIATHVDHITESFRSQKSTVYIQTNGDKIFVSLIAFPIVVVFVVEMTSKRRLEI